jgi:hypothetical protein
MGGMSMGRGFGGNAMRAPGIGQSYPGGDGQRYPGGMVSRRPGGGVLVTPSGGPYGYGRPGTVVEIDDGPRRITKKKRRSRRCSRRSRPRRAAGSTFRPRASSASCRTRFCSTVPRHLDARARCDRAAPSPDAARAARLRDDAARLARLRINDGRAVGTGDPLAAGRRAHPRRTAELSLFARAGRGARRRPPQYALGKLRLSEAHALARGASVRVAVVDTTIDAKHPDLAGAVRRRSTRPARRTSRIITAPASPA